jgi:hypothetical protein
LRRSKDTEELRRLGDTGEWPERLQRNVRVLGLEAGNAERESD